MWSTSDLYCNLSLTRNSKNHGYISDCCIFYKQLIVRCVTVIHSVMVVPRVANGHHVSLMNVLRVKYVNGFICCTS